MIRCIVSIIVLIMLGDVIANAQPVVLQPEQGVRIDPVIAGRLKIRFQRDVDVLDYPQILNTFNLRILYPILPFDLSLSARGNLTLIPTKNYNEALRIEEELLRTFVVEYADVSVSPEKYASLLKGGCSAFEVIETVVVSQILAKPNDPQVDVQKMLNTIQVLDAWDVEDGDETVLIGISDSGIFQDHEDLRDAIYVNTGEIPDNNIDDDNNGYVDDYRGYNFATPDDGTPRGNTFNSVEGHGTGVSGICGASVNNGVGVAGVANRSKLVPMKTMPENIGGIVYGYESLIYSALNGFSVVNCSWGSQSKSCIDSTVVAYVIARGTAIVGAAGNHGSSARFYPSSYPGVLGVGVSDENDGVVSMTAFGPFVDVMAPGQNTRTTANDGTYTTFCCTSGAAPIVSGVVGLVRAKYKQLSPIEASALVREAVDVSPWTSVPSNVDSLLLPTGRVNALKAVSLNPDSIPSLEFGEPAYRSTGTDSRWGEGDTVIASVKGVNVLGPWEVRGSSVIGITSAASDPGITYLGASLQSIGMLQKGENLEIEVRCRINRNSDTAAFVVGEVYGVTPAGDSVIRKFSIPIIPAPGFRDLQNDVVRLSVGDRARIGNTDLAKSQGSGFSYLGWCGQLFEGGLLVSANGRVADVVRAEKGINEHFNVVKSFTSPDSLYGVVQDANAPDSVRIGVEVQQRVRLAGADSGVYTSEITLTNISNEILNDVAIAWFFDWDLGTKPASNTVYLFSNNGYDCAEAASSTEPGMPFVLCSATSDYSDARAISAGIDNSTTYGGFSSERKLKILNSGCTEQFDGVGDVAIVSGMKFIAPLPPRQQRKYTQVIVIDTSQTRAQEMLLKYTERPKSSAAVSILSVFPLPASDYIQIQCSRSSSVPATISVVDVQGRIITSVEYPSGFEPIVSYNVRSLASGTYRITITQQDGVTSAPLVIIR
ncbi:MAG: S8 family peptidase [Ignavibacteria bacterium]|nr:S8 family peptidase [Ignavibacteria bacterium]